MRKHISESLETEMTETLPIMGVCKDVIECVISRFTPNGFKDNYHFLMVLGKKHATDRKPKKSILKSL